MQNAVNDTDEDVRIVVARSLKMIQTAAGPSEQVQRLIRELQSPDEIVRLKAAKDLGKLGSAAVDAIPALQKLLQDPEMPEQMSFGFTPSHASLQFLDARMTVPARTEAPWLKRFFPRRSSRKPADAT